MQTRMTYVCELSRNAKVRDPRCGFHATVGGRAVAATLTLLWRTKASGRVVLGGTRLRKASENATLGQWRERRAAFYYILDYIYSC
jgi:hypothetical protein